MQEDRMPAAEATELRALYHRVLSLGLFRGVLEDEPGEVMRDLLEGLSEPYAGEQDHAALIDSFGHLTALLLSEAVDYEGERVGDPWQNHLLDRILEDSNLFSVAAERGEEGRLPRPLLQWTTAELETLRQLRGLSLDRMQRAITDLLGDGSLAWPVWDQDDIICRTRAGQMKQRLARAGDWAGLVPHLAAYYAETGTGLFGRYRAFRWVVRDGAGALQGVPAPDPIGLHQIIGYDREQQVVLRNTRHFVMGAPANNVLLYGDAGTGKSSLIKALLNAFGDDGLRLVEVAKEHLTDFPYIAQLLRRRKERFVLFVDDLSFEEYETEYKGLKALLEGSVDARPANVLVYATSNRRHLVKEHFGDRSMPGDEDVHPHETVQEKLSLAERFGVRVPFLAPDQERYFTIVSALAHQEGLTLAEGELRRRALQWAQWQNGFSGRTARQFINDLQGEIADPSPPG